MTARHFAGDAVNGLVGAEDGGGSIEKFASFIKDEQQKWAQVAKAANVKVDA